MPTAGSARPKVLLWLASVLAMSAMFFLGMLLYWKPRNLPGLAIIHGLNDFLPSFLSDAFAFRQAEEAAEGYTSGDVSTTILYGVRLVVTGLCFLAVYKMGGKTIDYKKILEEW